MDNLLPKSPSQKQRIEERSEPQNQAEFDQYFEELNATPKQYLKLFLEGKADQEIADLMHCDRTNVPKHIYGVCTIFGLQKLKADEATAEGTGSHKSRERDSRRDDLIDLFVDYKPEWVCQELKDRHKLSKDNPPEPENPDGQMRLDSIFYVERPPVEANCFREITKQGALIRIKAPGQMGKSSLSARIMNHARQEGYRTVLLDLRSAGTGVFASQEQFLYWFCSRITRKLDLMEQLSSQLTDYWQGSAIMSNSDKCTDYIEYELLPLLKCPLVIGLDEVDELFKYPAISADFFALLRAWHEDAKASPIWEDFRLVITHSKEVYASLNINRSPFNVGLAIGLLPFTLEQLTDLVQRHRLRWTEAEIGQLMKMVGGHPYLSHMALYHITQGSLTLRQWLKSAPTEAGLYANHLRRLLIELENAGLMTAMQHVVNSSEPAKLDSNDAFKLVSLGLVQHRGNSVEPICDLYRQYFKEHLI